VRIEKTDILGYGHTFSTSVTLGNNVSMENISKMFAHKSITNILDKK